MTTKNLFIFIASVLLIVGCSLPVILEADTSPEESKLQIVWERQPEKGYYQGTPLVVGNTIFIGSSDEGMWAFDLQTGEPIWNCPIDEEIFAPAAHFDGLIFVGDIRGVLYALDAESGEEKWQFDTKGTIDNSPSIDVQTKRVLIGSQKGILYALESATGEKVWEYETDDQIRCCPAIADRYCFVAGCDAHLHVVALDTGEEISRIPLDSPTGTTPLLVGDFAFVGTEGNEFLAVDWKQEKVLWRMESKQAIRSPAVYREGVVIFGGMDKTVYALDAMTGEERWKYKTKGLIEGGAVLVGDRVYVPSMDSSLYVFDFRSGELIDSIGLTGKLSTAPAVASDRIVIATDEGVLTGLQ